MRTRLQLVEQNTSLPGGDDVALLVVEGYGLLKHRSSLACPVGEA
jgi:hypothetical protein